MSISIGETTGLNLNGTSAGVEGSETACIYRVPASHTQKRFWVWSQLNPDSPTFNVAVRWKLEGEIDQNLLEQACNLLVARHEPLRTAIVAHGRDVVQEIRESIESPMRYVDLQSHSRVEAESKAEDLAVAEARAPFHLAHAPLVRFTLVRLEERYCIFLCTAHHAICDGVSVGILADDLGQIYDALSRGMNPELPEQAVQFADFAIWQSENPQTEVFERQLQYWQKTLHGYRPFEVEPDSPRAAVKTTNGHIVSRLVPRAITDECTRLAKNEGCSLFAVSLAALTILLQRISHATDITLGTQVVGRNRAEIENVVGVFTNTLPLRIQATEQSSVEHLVRQVREVVFGALENQDVPFDQIVKAVDPQPDVRKHPIFQVHFIFQRSFVHNRVYEKFTLTDMPSRSPGAGFDLNFFMVERVDGWRLSCEFNIDLFRQSTVEWMLQMMEQILARIPQELSAPLSTFVVERPATQQPRSTAKSSQNAVAAVPAKKTAVSVEEALVALFREVLAIDQIEADDSFFDLGGHSILAAQIFARIEQQWSVRLSLATLVQSPSPRALAHVLMERSFEKLSDRVVPLQMGSKPPIFVISQSLVFRNVAKELGSDQAVYALRMPLEEAQRLEAPYTMQAIAAYYVALLREVQPHGPYRLAGWCVAATIAYEVAQQLAAMGEEVELLGLFDSWAPRHFRRMSLPLRALTEVAYMGHRAMLRLKARFAKSHPATIAGRKTAQANAEPTPVEKMEYAAAAVYEPRPYRGRVVLCCSEDQPVGFLFDKNMGWSKYLSPVPPIHRIPGSHLAMFDQPGAGLIARQMNSALAPSSGVGTEGEKARGMRVTKSQLAQEAVQ